jgi:hypothetical protein
MVLSATVESKELKGYILNLGFKDGAKGFVKFEQAKGLQLKQLVTVVVKGQSSKVIKCELLDDNNKESAV